LLLCVAALGPGSCVSYMQRPPPISPLFPYTTLFRSSMPKADLARLTNLSTQTISLIINRLLEEGLVSKRAPVRGKVGQPSVPIIDRKSTRLNSSHVKISYAVFCLKTKSVCHRRRSQL